MVKIKELVEVAIYLRKSREEAEETREETLARHERMLIEYCNRNNLIVKKIYKEVVSGESIENRPQMQLLLDDVAAGLYNGVVCIEIERLSRGNQIDQVEILEVFKQAKAKIYTLNKIYDFSNDNEIDEEYFEFGLFMSRREYKMIKRRLMRGRKQAQKEGYFVTGNLPFGYTKIKGDRGYILTPDENAETLKLIFYKYVYEDYSLAQLRQYLIPLNCNSKGFRTNDWESRKLRRLLSNNVYLGYIRTNTKKDNGLVCYKGKHEPLIDEETFNLAQEKLKGSSTKSKKGKELKNPLATLVKCSCCGRTMQMGINKRVVLRCPKYNCGNHSSRFDIVEKKIIDELEQELKNFNYFLENYDDELKEKKENIEKEKLLIKKEITKKENMVTKCCELLEQGVYTKEKYFERTKILESELNMLKSEYDELCNLTINNDEKIARKSVPILEKILKEYWNLNPQQKNDLLKSFIEKIEYTKTKKDTANRNPNADLIDLKIYTKI